jgi:hypothetical protein
MLIGAYERLEAIPDDVVSWKVTPRGAAQLASTLAAGRAEALLYRELATLVETADVSTSLDELRFRGVPRAGFQDWCRVVGAGALSTAPRRWEEP